MPLLFLSSYDILVVHYEYQSCDRALEPRRLEITEDFRYVTHCDDQAKGYGDSSVKEESK